MFVVICCLGLIVCCVLLIGVCDSLWIVRCSLSFAGVC